MNHDELLNIYFNNELSNGELDEFNNLLDSDQAFNRQFETMRKLEKDLNELQTELTINDYAFIESTGNKLAGGSAQTGSAAAGSSIFANMKIMLISVIGISLIAVLSFFAFKYFTQNEPESNKQTIQITSNQPVQTNKIEKKSTGTNEQINRKQESRKENPIQHNKKESKTTKVSENIDETQHDGEIQGQIKDINPVKNQEIISQLQNELSEYHKNGDLLNETWTLKRLGIFYRQLGNYTQSENYLQKALSASENMQDDVLKAEIYGELAYLDYTRGNYQKANKYANKCLSILQTKSAKRAQYWQKKFKRFQ